MAKAMHRSSIPNRAWLQSGALAAVVGACYFLAACLSLHLTQGVDGNATIWFASGVSVSALLLVRPGQSIPLVCAVGLASMASNLLFGASMQMALGFTIANIVEGLLISQLVIRTSGAPRMLDDRRWLATFVAATVAGSAASSGIAAVVSGNLAIPFLLSWFMTVCLGTLVTTPLIVTIVNGVREDGHDLSLRQASILTLLAIGIASVSWFARTHEDGRFLFLPVIGVTTATYFYGSRGAAASISVIAVITTVQTDFSGSAIGWLGMNGDTLFLQFYLLSLLCAAWPLSALIHEKKGLIEQYAKANTYLKLAESTARVGHWYLGSDSRSLFWSEEVYRIHGVDPQGVTSDETVDLAQFSSLMLYHPEDRARVRTTLLAAMEREQGFRYEARVVRPDGSIRYVSSNGHPRHDASGAFEGLFGTFHDITDQTETLEALRIARSEALHEASVAQRLAETDDLTGIANRRKIMARLRTVGLAAKRRKSQLTIAIVDIDHFKMVNDRHGHHVGDEVLKRVAGIMSGHLRSTDMVGRLGGEEFLVILPGENGDNGYKMIERLRVRIASETGAAASLPAVTISAGLATLAEDGDIEETLRRADEALYEAKEGGRNLLRSAA